MSDHPPEAEDGGAGASPEPMPEDAARVAGPAAPPSTPSAEAVAEVVALDGTPWSRTDEEDRQRGLVDKRKRRADQKKREFTGIIAGAKIRLPDLPRELVQSLGFGVANFVLMQVLTGKIEIRTAQEAAAIAKVGVEIGRLELGEGGMSSGPVPPHERARMIKNAEKLQMELRERKKKLQDDQRKFEEGDPVPRSSIEELGERMVTDDDAAEATGGT